MFYDFANMTWSQIAQRVIWDIAKLGFTFALFRWLVTDNLWLCFFLSGASVTAQTANAKADKLFTALQAVGRDFNNNDEHKKMFDERIEFLESKIDELEQKNYDLESKLDEFGGANHGSYGV